MASIEAELAAIEGQPAHATSVALRIALAEGRRRIAGDIRAQVAANDAVAAAEELGDEALLVAAHLVASVRAWTVADERVAQAELDAARAFTTVGTAAAAHCDLAGSRLARLHNDTPTAEALTTSALAVFEAVDDPDGLADAQRELAAIALLTNRPDRARRLADAALDHHRRRGDRPLAVLAGVLVARVTNRDDPERAVTDLHALQAEAVELGSPDLEVLTVTYLSQMLQTLCSQDPRWWPETELAIARAIELADDPFTRAEVLAARAAFKVRTFALEGIDEDLDEADRLYAEVGNPAGLGGVAKIRARATWARAAGAPSRRLALRREAARLWAESNALYVAGHMPGAARSALLDQLIGRVVLAGGALDADELALVAAPDGEGDERRNAVRALLLEAYDQLQRGRPKEARKLLKDARSRLGGISDHQLAAATDMGLAQADLALGKGADALAELRSGLEELARFDLALSEPGQRSRFAATVEPLTRQALALAVANRDAETGLRLLEYRRTGRLSGLLRRTKTLTLTSEVSELLDRLDQFRDEDQPDGTDRRSIEAPTSAGWEACHHELADATSRLFAETYDPTGIDVRALVEALPATTTALILDRPYPDRPEQLVRAVVPGGAFDRIEVEEVQLSAGALEVLDLLNGTTAAVVDVKARLRSPDLRPLSEALLGAIATDDDRPRPRDLLIIPTGALWAVPFAGLPVKGTDGTTTLIEQTTITLAPSLRFHDVAARRAPRSGTGAQSWRSPELGTGVDEHQALDVLGAGHVRAANADRFASGFCHAPDLAIAAAAGHGIQDAGLAHGVRLDKGRPLRGADLLGATTARLVLLGACGAGFTPGTEHDEPVGFPTLAMCAGAEAVVGPCIELENTTATAEYLAALYGAMAEGGHPSTVHHQVTTHWLATEGNRRRPLVEWAAMGVLGTVPPG